MSAWVVSQKHIDFIVTYAVGYRVTPIEDADKVGAMLWRENVKSVNYRYSERKQAPEYKFRPFDPCSPLSANPVALLKAIDCLNYQSCEHKGWEKSDAKKFLSELYAVAVGRLEGYDAAPWGID